MAIFKGLNENNDQDGGADNTSGSASETPAANSTEARVAAVIDELRPYLQADGGDIELLKVEDNVVYVRLVGACHGCPSATITLKMGVERRIREVVPEIVSVETA